MLGISTDGCSFYPGLYFNVKIVIILVGYLYYISNVRLFDGDCERLLCVLKMYLCVPQSVVQKVSV